MSARYSIGVDLGGTNLRAAVIQEDGKLLEKVSSSTPLGDSPEPAIEEIVRSIQKLRTDYGTENLAGVGVGVPGFIRMEEGVIVGWGNRPAFNGYPVRAEIEKRLGARVVLENDANAAALGETWMGAGRGVDDLVLLALGTGLGGGIISRGRVLRGYLGMAGELGHITVVPNGNPCGCGNNGCLEKHASATAIAAMGHLLMPGSHLTSEEVYKLAVDGNVRALSVFRTLGEALGLALATLINIFNFPLYLLSGGPLPAWDFFAPAMFKEVERRSYTYRIAPTRIEKAALGNEAGLYGAAYLPYQDLSALK
jgi:glucokinase